MDWAEQPEIARLLKAGGLVAYPTEAVWGLGCDPDNEQAVHKLLALKQRPMEKGLILVAAEMAQFEPYLDGLPLNLRETLRASWPGPVTWLVPDNGRAASWVRGQHSSVALRVSAHPAVAALCRAFGGPLISTSANRAGEPEARDAATVQREFGAELAAIVPGELGGSTRPSEIRDLLSGSVLRPG